MALIPISPETHAKTKIRPLTSVAFAAGSPVVSICASESVAFCHEVPVVFIADGEALGLAALTGLSSDRNMLIDEAGRWHGSQMPALWKRGPFRLAKIAGADEGRLALCLDDSSDQISETEGKPLFDETGTATPLLAEASNILGKLETELRQTRAICSQLQSLGLLAPWPLEITQPNGEKVGLKGLFRVDEPKIAQLSGDDLVALRNSGALVTIYAHLLSLSKLGLLGKIAQQLALRDQQRQAVVSNKVDLDRAFGIVEDDPFIF